MLGQNGAGKTTTINIFLGFTEATSGLATINDVEVKPGNPATKKFVAYIPEVVQLYGNLTGLENLDFFSRPGRCSKYSKEVLYRVFDGKGRVCKTEARQKAAATHSKGMRQKVGIAVAIARARRSYFNG